MIMDGCQGKPRTPTIEDRICPNCGNPIEIFSTDTEVACDNCGFIVYNDKLSSGANTRSSAWARKRMKS